VTRFVADSSPVAFQLILTLLRAAVLLDEFLKAQTNERKSIAEENQILEDIAQLQGPLDPLLQQLAFFRSR
jgi:dynactin complex subunit